MSGMITGRNSGQVWLYKYFESHCITISNTGPGVPEHEISRVFDQFYRVEKSRSTDHGGSGLGLAIVKRIIELHGGEVGFESRKGNWTRVTVMLPQYHHIKTLKQKS